MKKKLLSLVLFITVMSVAAASFANIAINPLVQDLFGSCFEQVGPEPTTACEYGTQAVYAGVSGVFLMIFAMAYGFKRNAIFSSKVAALMTGPAYLVARLVVWRLYLRLPAHFSGDDKSLTDYLRDYLDVSFLVMAGLAVGIGYVVYYLIADMMKSSSTTVNAPAEKPKKAPAKKTSKSASANKKKTTAKKKTTTKKKSSKKSPKAKK